MARKKPYTSRGIQRLKCFRCGRPAKYQWQICSDGNVYRPLCEQCDIALNQLVLVWMRFKDWKQKMQRYINLVRGRG